MTTGGSPGEPDQVRGVLGDPGRLAALRLAGLDARPDEAFDRYTRLVTRLLHVPVSLVSLVDDSRQYFPGNAGLVSEDGPMRETPLSHSFCQYVVASGEPLVVPDALEDALVCDNLAVPDLGVVAYAGMPLTDEDGQVLGSLCAIDTEARSWSEDELETLRDVAESVSAELRLRLSLARLRDVGLEAELARRRIAEEQSRAESSEEAVTAAQARAALATSRLTLLSELGEVLLDSRSSESVYKSLVDLLVPRLADSCEVHVMDDGRPVRVASAGDAVQGSAAAVRSVLRAEQSLAVGTSHLVVVLPTAGEASGALTLHRSSAPFARDDVLAAVEVARRAGLALDNAGLLARQRTVAETLQHGLLRTLPVVPGLHLAARYLPALTGNDVGGDWYDGFVRADGRTAVVVGDLVGHDLAAATRMGELSTLVRATAYDHPDGPAAALERVDSVVSGLRADLLATVVVAYLDRTADGVVVTWSAAGHPSPFVVDVDGGTRVLLAGDEPGDLLVGLGLPGPPRTDRRCLLRPGESLLLYTDGLVERRHEDLDESLGWLRALIARRSADGQASIDALADAVLEAATVNGASDDVALLAVSPG